MSRMDHQLPAFDVSSKNSRDDSISAFDNSVDRVVYTRGPPREQVDRVVKPDSISDGRKILAALCHLSTSMCDLRSGLKERQYSKDSDTVLFLLRFTFILTRPF